MIETVRRDLRRRDEILMAVAFVGRRLLGSADWRTAVPEVLGRLGTAAGVSRVFLFEGRTDPDGHAVSERVATWRSEGGVESVPEAERLVVDWSASGVAWVPEALRRGEAVVGRTADFPRSWLRERIEAEGIVSHLLVPVSIGESCWGFLGFDDVNERDWSLPETQALQAAGAALGEAIRRTAAEEKLRESEERLRTLIDASPDPIYLKDGEGHWLIVNRTGLAAFDLEGAAWQGKNEAALAEMKPAFRQALLTCRDTDEAAWLAGTVCRADEVIQGPEGGTSTFDVIKAPTFWPDGRRKALVVIGRDITERVAAERELHRNAFFDRLTGLPNRALLLDRLGVSLRRAHGRSSGAVAVLYLDVDRFKNVNDGLGHRAGDVLLREIPRRLDSVVGEGATLSRLGADEFVVVLDDVDGEEEAMRTAERLRRSFAEPFVLHGQSLHVTASIGVALGRDDERSAEDLLRDAHTALVRAKEAGRNAEALFDEVMHAEVVDRLDLESALRRAVGKGELELHYQPIVDVATGARMGFEALLRWNHPQRGLLRPAAFVDLAEETGLIVPIGAWVLREACGQLLRWRERWGRWPIVNVNCSPRQLIQPQFPADVAAVLARTGVPPSALAIEITESTLVDRPEMATFVLGELRRLGLRIVLDDFGTGYSSLAYLLRFAVDGFKIDRSFVGALPEGANAAKIAGTLLVLARALGLSVTAEGVETAEQLAWLKQRGCDRAQGHLFAPALPPGDVDA